MQLEALAIESELEFARHEAVKRTAFVPDNQLVKEVFLLPEPLEGDVIEAVLPGSNGFAVVQLDSVKQGQLEGVNSPLQQQYERIISNASASQETSALMSQLRALAKIEVYEDRIQ